MYGSRVFNPYAIQEMYKLTTTFTFYMTSVKVYNWCFLYNQTVRILTLNLFGELMMVSISTLNDFVRRAAIFLKVIFVSVRISEKLLLTKFILEWVQTYEWICHHSFVHDKM